MSNPDLADDIRALEEALAAGPVPGPWTWWTSCSFRRLSSDATGKDGDVLHGTWQRSDGHPDIVATQPTMDFIAAANPDRVQRVLTTLTQLQQEQTLAGEVQADAATQDAELQQLREQAARYHWLCANLARIHIETTQPAGSPEDAPMRVTLMQVWPELPKTEPESVDAAVGEAMKEGL